MAARTLQELADQKFELPLTEKFLKGVRTALIQKSKSGVLGATNEKYITNLIRLFTSILQTALIPTLTQPHRALSCDAISTWLIRSSTSSELQQPLQGGVEGNAIWDSMVSVIFSNFDDAQSGLSKALKDLLGNLLSSYPEGDERQVFMGKLAERILVGIKSRGRKKVGYYVLEVLVKKRFVGAAWIMRRYGQLGAPQKEQIRSGDGDLLVLDMLSSLKDRTLSPSIGKALISLLSVRQQEITGVGGTQKGWMGLWDMPLKKALASEELRGNVQIYALPGLFKISSGCFRAFVEGLGLLQYSSDRNGTIEVGGEGGDSRGELMSLLCCLKVGKDLGFVDEINDDPPHDAKHKNKNTISIPSSLVTPLLSHMHPQIRLSALTLLTYTPTFTRPLPSAAFYALQCALSPLHTETDAEVRNLVTGSIRGLIERLGSSSYALEKDILNLEKKDTLSEPEKRKISYLRTQIVEVRTFILWYLRFLQTQLQPGANYQRVTTALRVLTTLIRSGLDTTLVSQLFSEGEAGSKKKGLLRWPSCFEDVVVFDEGMRRVLLDCLFNPFDDVRAMAAEVLKFAPSGDVGESLGRLLERGVENMNISGRARDSDGVARVVELWFELVERGVKVGGCVCGVEVNGGKGVKVVEWVLEVLETRYLSVARGDFQKAVKERPVHGLLAALRLILERRDAYAVGEREEWRRVHERVFRACVEIWEITRGVLCEESPEGHMPEIAGEEEDEDVNTQTVMSYSWRAVKESSALLGTILNNAPYTATPTSILTQRDFEAGGGLLLSQLANIRHRGAFSAVSPSFITLCTCCFKSPDPALQNLPKTWLAENLSLIMSKSNAITRRSAGLPFLIVGILISETDPARPLLKSSFAQLVEIAALLPASKNGCEKMDLPQVHALNCMKFLFTDSRLSAAADDHVGTGLEIAVKCFASGIWAIRNCGIMMFTTLLNRLFGTSRSRNDYACMRSAFDARGFFERYPSVRGVLLGNLREQVGALGADDTSSVEMVYPALSLIARLDYVEGYEDMAEFEPLIVACMRSRIWKVREMAAKAYSALVGSGDIVKTVQILLSDTADGKQNRIHGDLNAVRVLLERRGGKGTDVLASIWKSLGSVFNALVRSNRCSVTKALYLHILTDHAISSGLLDEEKDVWLDMLTLKQNKEEIYPSDDTISGLRKSVSTYCNRSDEFLSEISHASIVGRSLLKEQLARFMVARAVRQPTTDNRIQEIIQLLDSPDEETALAIATLLLDTEQPLPLTPKESSSLDSTLWKIIGDHEWNQLRVAALKLIGRYGCSEAELEKRWRMVMDLVKTPPSEPCKDTALAALGEVTEKIWLSWQTIEGGDIWAVWCLDELVKELRLATHEDMPYPTREAALDAMRALTPVLGFSRLPSWRSHPHRLRVAYFALYDMLNDDDEDIRDGAAAITCSILGEKVQLTPLKAGEALATAMGREFHGSADFFNDVVIRLTDGAKDAEVVLKEAMRVDTILFAREKQNLFVDHVVEAERWASVLEICDGEEGEEGRKGFVFWVMAGLVALAMKVKELGREGALGWMGDEDVFVLGVKVLEGLRVVAGWWKKDDVEDVIWGRVEGVGRELEQELKRVEGHELWVRKLKEIL